MVSKYIYPILIIFSLQGCQKHKAHWEMELKGITTMSSPKSADLNEDGIEDIVMGAGGEEWQPSNLGIIAIDGAYGSLLWHSSARNQIVGSALFEDITGDAIPDVFIGGRTLELQALDGKTGRKIWEFAKISPTNGMPKAGLLNFYNPQLIDDQNNDNVKDLLICNGGDATKPAGYNNRPVGYLMIISGKDGKEIAKAKMPDGRETYYSPLITTLGTKTNNPFIIVGTGGETITGHLYLTTLKDLKANDISKAIVLDSSKYHGYIAPPVLADINNDEILDIVVNGVEGRTVAIDGKTLKPIWTITYPKAEVYSMPALGYFTGNDKNLDVFVNYSMGVYPQFLSSTQLLIDGKTGKVVKEMHEQSFSYASPLTADLNNDGHDDVLVCINYDIAEKEGNIPYFKLQAYDFFNQSHFPVGDSLKGANFASTPLLKDIDKNGKIDMIYAISPAVTKFYPGISSFQKPEMKLKIFRSELPNVKPNQVRWGSYMGNKSDGIYPLLKK